MTPAGGPRRGLLLRRGGAVRTWWRPVSVGAAILAVAAALALPAPEQQAPAETGPPGLADVWPAAQIITLASSLRGGDQYQPMLFLDATTSVGLATSPDLSTSKLVVLAGDAAPRELRILQGEQRATIAAVATATIGSVEQLFWLEIADDGDGVRQTAVWRADLRSGPARLLAKDSSDVLYFDSGYDLQVGDGQVRWAAAPSSAEGRSGGEIRSVPVDGGPVSVRSLDRLYALTAWPWATSSGSSQPGDVELLNLVTGEKKTVAAGENEILTCTPQWCRVTTLVNQGQSLKFEVEHVDGSARRVVGTTNRTPLNTDVGLLDRFEVLASTATGGDATGGDVGDAQQLWLYDLAADRAVLLDSTTTATIGSRGPYLWWSTGDNETLSWHVVDLRQLS